METVLAFLFLALVTAPGAALATPADDAVARARDMKLAESIEWRRLVHYEHLALRGWVSQADGENFFIAKNGKKNPEAELEATLRGFFTTEKRILKGHGQIPQTVYCQFPARFKFLDRKLGLKSKLPTQECPDFETFRSKTAAKSATLVFSSFYGSNPSSIYGHSLIRINKTDGSSGSEQRQLLDTGVNYAAFQTTSNPILYALYGLTGFFEGQFSTLPYFFKVREYADFESRDLWEYDLDLTQDEVDMMTAHVWEVGTSYFDYFYLTENCSYHMLTLIEAAAPRYNLVDKIPYWVLPSDTVKALFKANAVTRTNFRPSVNTQFRTRYDKLSEPEKKSLFTLIHQDRKRSRPATALPNDDLSPTERANVLDAYMDYVDLHYARDLYQKNPEFAAPKQSLLVARSKLPVTQALDFSKPPVASPHLSHPSARAGVWAVEDLKHGTAVEASMRFALHDLLDSSLGLPKYSDIDFFHLQMRYWTELDALKLERFTLFGVGSFQPIDEFTKSPTWRLKMGAKRFDDVRCENCVGGFIEGAVGYSYEPLSQLLFFGLAESHFDTAPRFEKDKFGLRLGPTVGTRIRFSEKFGILTEGKFLFSLGRDSFEERIVDSRLRWTPVENLGLDIGGLWTSQRQEVKAGFVGYF